MVGVMVLVAALPGSEPLAVPLRLEDFPAPAGAGSLG